MAEAQDLSLFVRHPAEGVAAMDLVVDGVNCGACIVTIEKGLGGEAACAARASIWPASASPSNGTTARSIRRAILERLEALGYPAYPFAADARRQRRGGGGEAAAALPRRRRLRRDERDAALGRAVGRRATRPQRLATRDLFHWLSALVALPCGGLCRAAVLRQRGEGAARSARSTWTCRSRSASCWRSAMSVAADAAHARDAYFDSAMMLLMFLLAGRYPRSAHAPAAHATSPSISRRSGPSARSSSFAGRRSARDADRGDPARRSRAGRAPASASPSTAWSRTGAPRSTRAW